MKLLLPYNRYNVSLRHTSVVSEELKIGVYSLNGALLANQNVMMHPGNNTVVIDIPSSSPPGNYMPVIKSTSGETVHHSRLVKRN